MVKCQLFYQSGKNKENCPRFPMKELLCLVENVTDTLITDFERINSFPTCVPLNFKYLVKIHTKSLVVLIVTNYGISK